MINTIIMTDEDLRKLREWRRRIIPKVETTGYVQGRQAVSRRFETINGTIGDHLEVIIVSRVVERRYTPIGTEGEAPKPICFALASARKGMHPHKDSARPQSTACDFCEWDRWQLVKGRWQKRCREYRRLAIIAPFAPDEIKVLRFPPASLAAWRDYTKKILAPIGKRHFQVVTALSLNENVDYPSLRFKFRSVLPEKWRSKANGFRKQSIKVLMEP